MYLHHVYLVHILEQCLLTISAVCTNKAFWTATLVAVYTIYTGAMVEAGDTSTLIYFWQHQNCVNNAVMKPKAGYAAVWQVCLEYSTMLVSVYQLYWKPQTESTRLVRVVDQLLPLLLSFCWSWEIVKKERTINQTNKSKQYRGIYRMKIYEFSGHECHYF